MEEKHGTFISSFLDHLHYHQRFEKYAFLHFKMKFT